MSDFDTLKSLDLPTYLETAHGLTPGPGSKQGNPLYCCPFHADKTPSLSVFSAKSGGWRWRCHGCDIGGTILDFEMKAAGVELAEAAALIAKREGIEWRPSGKGGPPRPTRVLTKQEQLVQWLAKVTTTHHQVGEAAGYLTEKRRISQKIVDQLLHEKRIGFSDHKGVQGVAFTILSWPAAEVVAVDVRRWNATNPKDTQRHHGEGTGDFWWHNKRRLSTARTVWIAESTIDALSLECAGKTAIGLRTWHNIERDWSWLRGKRVFICLDGDAVDGDQRGQEGTRRLYRLLTAAGAHAKVVGLGWEDDGKVDPNSVLQQGGAELLKGKLRDAIIKKPVWDPEREMRLPGHLRALNGGERGIHDRGDHVTARQFKDGELRQLAVCDFSIRSVSVVDYLDYSTGEPDRTLFRYQFVGSDTSTLRSLMVEEHRRGDPQAFAPCGLIHQPTLFKLYLSLVHYNREEEAPVKNIVGLVEVAGTPRLCDASNMDFLRGPNECIYAGMRFPSGTLDDGRAVWDGLTAMWTEGQGELVATWILGSFLKLWLRFWPHLQGAAPKGTGKSTFLEVLADAFHLKTISGEEVSTPYRRKVAVSNSLFPFAMDEASRHANGDGMAQFFNLLNSSYKHELTHHGADRTRLNICAPYLFFGQDTPSDDGAFQSKVIPVTLTPDSRGAIPRIEAPFPLREWAEWLAAKRPDVVALLHDAKVALLEDIVIPAQSSDADRLITNGAALLVARDLVGEFLDRPDAGGAFFEKMKSTVDVQIHEVSGISSKESVEPLYLFANLLNTDPNAPKIADVRHVPVHGDCLVVAPKLLLTYLQRQRASTAIRTPRTLVARLKDDGLLIGQKQVVIGGKRHWTVVLPLDRLREHGVDFPAPETTKGLNLD